MKKGPGLLIMAVCLMALVVGSLITIILVHFNTDNGLEEWWEIPLIVVATLCLIGWVIYRARKQFL